MLPYQEDNRPPYVEFETRAVEDRTATIAEGHFVAKDVIYAIITPAGSKDRIERVADEWLAHISTEASKQRFAPQWVDYYQAAFKKFKEGQEVPVNGTPLAHWPGVSPAQHRMLIDINIRTVEDLANANEEAIGYLGMGARSLVQRAQAFLEAKGSGTSKLAEENAELKNQLAATNKRCDELEKVLHELKQQTGTGVGKRPQKPSEDD